MNSKIISGISSCVFLISAIVFFIIYTKNWVKPSSEEEKNTGSIMTFIAIILILLAIISCLLIRTN